MQVSRREQVLAKIATVIAALGALQEFARNQQDDWVPEDIPFAHQADGGDDALDGSHGEDNYVADVEIEFGGKARPDEDPHAMVNRLYAEAWKRLSADPTLGGLAQDVRLQGLSVPAFVDEEGVGAYVAASMGIRVFFATAEGDPFSAPD